MTDLGKPSPPTEEKPPRKTGWKKGLLSSGVPLEHQVARRLTEADFFVSADFSYSRIEGTSSKDHSVDIEAVFVDSDDDQITYSINLLVECKHRSRDKSLVFFPDPNDEFSPIAAGQALVTFDWLNPYRVDKSKIEEFEENLPVTIKGVEVSENGTDPNAVRHGLEQLRYATPAYLKGEFEFEISNGPEDIPVVFFARILVTNAPIRLFDSDATIEQIERADRLEDLASEHPVIIAISGHGPDYADHFRRTFNSSFSSSMSEPARHLRSRLLRAGKIFRGGEDPSYFIEELVSGTRYLRRSISDQSFVCTIDGLTGLVSDLKALCSRLYKDRTVDEAVSGPE